MKQRFLLLILSLFLIMSLNQNNLPRANIFRRPKCGRRMLSWLQRKFHEQFPTKFLLQPPLNRQLVSMTTSRFKFDVSTDRVARKYSKPPGCKFPFHDGLYRCCRLARGDCTLLTIQNIRDVNRKLHECLRVKRDLRRCWVEAEKSRACQHSSLGFREMMIVNGGKTW